MVASASNPYVRINPVSPLLPPDAFYRERPPLHELVLCDDHRHLKPGEKAVLAFLWTKVRGKDGPPATWRFAKDLAPMYGTSERTFHRHCAGLVGAGFLTLIKRYKVRGRGQQTSSNRLLLRPPCLRGGASQLDLPLDDLDNDCDGPGATFPDLAGNVPEADNDNAADAPKNGAAPDDGPGLSDGCHPHHDRAGIALSDPVHEKSFHRNPSLPPPPTPKRRKASKPAETEDDTLVSAVLKSLSNVTRKAVRDVSFDDLDGSTVKAISADIQREAQLGTWGRWQRYAPRYPEIWRILQWKLGGAVEAVAAGVKREAEAATARDTEAHARALDSRASESRSWLDSQPPPATPELLELWRQTLEGMEERIGAKGVEVWFRSLHPIDVAGDALRLQACNSYYAEHIGESYGDELAAELAALRGVPTSVTFVLRGEM